MRAFGKKYKTIVINPTKKKWRKSEIYSLVALNVVALLFLFGTSYAMLNSTSTGKKEVSITSGSLQTNFKDGTVVELVNAYPVSDAEGMKEKAYEFSVENTGNIQANYIIYLEEGANNSLDNENIKYSFQMDKENWSSPLKLSTLNGIVLKNKVTIMPGEKHVYRLKLWMSEEVENDAQGKEYKARITVRATQ